MEVENNPAQDLVKEETIILNPGNFTKDLKFSVIYPLKRERNV